MRVILFIAFFLVFSMFYISFGYDKDSQTTNYLIIVGWIGVFAFIFAAATIRATHVLRIKKILADKEE